MQKITLKRFNNCSLAEVGGVVNFLLNFIRLGKIIILNGDIGSGKTTLVRLISRRLGNKEKIISPSFNKMFIYKDLFCHIDCYNIKGKIDNLLEHCEGLPTFIEWGENCLNSLEVNKVIEVEISYKGEKRSYIISQLFV